MNTSITESWLRVESWLEAHAPATFAALETPATDADIAAAEAATGMSFPVALTAAMRRHAGTDEWDLLPGNYWLTTPAALADEWRSMTDVWRRAFGEEEARLDAEDDEFGPWFHPKWIPFARDITGEGMVIDMRDNGRTGRIGFRHDADPTSFDDDPLWTSFEEYFTRFAHCLETGERFDGWFPTVNEGRLDWDREPPSEQTPFDPRPEER